jgi:hypothetical protein
MSQTVIKSVNVKEHRVYFTTPYTFDLTDSFVDDERVIRFLDLFEYTFVFLKGQDTR